MALNSLTIRQRFSEIFRNRLMADRFVLERVINIKGLKIGHFLPPPIAPVGPQRKLEEALHSLALNLHEHDRLNLEEAFVDATFTSAKEELSPSLALLPQQGQQDHRYCHLYRVFLSPSLSKTPGLS
jgi:hypothetical protein